MGLVQVAWVELDLLMKELREVAPVGSRLTELSRRARLCPGRIDGRVLLLEAFNELCQPHTRLAVQPMWACLVDHPPCPFGHIVGHLDVRVSVHAMPGGAEELIVREDDSRLTHPGEDVPVPEISGVGPVEVASPFLGLGFRHYLPCLGGDADEILGIYEGGPIWGPPRLG